MPLKLMPVICLAATAVACAPQVDTAAELEAVRARSTALVTAEEAKDTETALAFWADDAVVQPAGAPQVEGKAAVRALYNEFFGMITSMESTTSGTVMSQGGDLAYEWGINRFMLSGPEGEMKDVGKYLVVWQKLDDEWYVVALSFTSDAPAPVPVEQ